MKRLFNIIIYLLIAGNINAQFSANFTADSTVGCEPLCVKFENTSTIDSNTSFFWDLGNGTTSTLKNPETIYTSAGYYSVSLIISNGNKTDTIIKQNFIHVLQTPKAKIFVNQDTVGCLPYSVHFVDSSDAQNISQWIWDFGDGNCNYEQNPEHTYTNTGNFTVKLYIVNENGCADQEILDNFIKVSKPTAKFNFDGENFSCSDTQTIFFKNFSSGENLSYFWNFGNNQTSTETNPTVTFKQAGQFDISLIATDIYGCSDTIIKHNIIENQQVTALFGIASRVNCPNEDVHFLNKSTNATNYLWNFDDNTPIVNDIEPIHKFSTGRNYNVTLIARNNFGCADTFASNVLVEKIKALFELDKQFICELPDTVHYINLSEHAVRYDWHFGNGTICHEENPVNIITNVGYFSDTLFAYSEHGCVDKFVIDSSLHVAIPRAYFTPNNWVNPFDIMGCVPLTVDFNDASSYETNEDSIISWQWDFDDGYTSAEQNPTHTFNSLDTFAVYLKITTAQGCSGEYRAWAKTGTRQFANFSADYAFDTICASTGVQFYNLSQDASLINTSYWLFGDSTYSTQREPQHFFTDTGWMDVKLIVYNNGCPDDTLIEDFVYVKAPYHEINYQINCDNPYQVAFSADMTGVEKFYWDFGDGSPLDSTNTAPVHTFPHRGWFTVTLTSSNSSECCNYSAEENILISAPNADFEVADTNLCVGETVLLNAGKSTDKAIFYENGHNCFYLWKFDDTDNYEYMIDSLLTHKFDKDGDFRVSLIIRGENRCYDTVAKTFHVHKPVCDFLALPQTGCPPLKVSFTNNTNSYFGIDSIFWNFGDNTFSNDTNPEHFYKNNGNYSVSLYVKDSLGCDDTLKIDNFINLHQPIPNFYANKQNICSNETVVFNFVKQIDSIVDVLWDFGDGTTSTELSPEHIYQDSGHYTVSLYLQDINGCDSLKTVEDYIFVQKAPTADFFADTTESDCYPLVVHFYDNSQADYVQSYFWQLDSNVVSNQKNPVYSYSFPDKYSVTLKVTTTNGCSDEITKQNFINVGGPYAQIQADDTVCKFATANFNAINVKNVNYLQWFFSDGYSAHDTATLHSFGRAGNYNVILLLKSDTSDVCNKFLSTNIFVRDINAGFDIDSITTACTPFEFYIDDTTTNTKNRQWFINNSLLDTAISVYNSFDTVGNYEIKLFETDKFGCLDTVTKNIFVNPLPEISIINDTFVCQGDKIKLWANGASNYEWTPTEFVIDEHSASPIAMPDSSMLFNVVGIDSNGCQNYASTFVKVIKQPNFFINDTSIIIGDTIILNNFADDIGQYSWSPSVGLSCDTCPNPLVSPQNSTTYTLTITDTANCFTLSKSISVDVMLKYSIDVPSAFTPNNDGINDIIRPDGWGIDELIYFKIYNRFGELIFSTNNLYEGWDGTYKGKPQPVETYRYSVAVKSYDGKIRTKQGTIKLIR